MCERTRWPPGLSPERPWASATALSFLSPSAIGVYAVTERAKACPVDVESHRELKVLEAISENERTSQRSLAAQLGIALGLTNLYLKRLVRKGYIKCVTIPSNRVLYLITPKGIAEKTRLTYEFMEYSLRVFRQGRDHLKAMLAPLISGG